MNQKLVENITELKQKNTNLDIRQSVEDFMQ